MICSLPIRKKNLKLASGLGTCFVNVRVGDGKISTVFD